MMSKKDDILKMYNMENNLSRIYIAEQVGCHVDYVYHVIGKYKKNERLFNDHVFNGLKITNIKICPYGWESKQKAFARITLNDMITLTGFRIFQNKREISVAFPLDRNNKNRSNSYNIYYAVPEFKFYIENEIKKAFNEYMKDQITFPF